MPTAQPEKRYQDGRDELNLADFPISVLQRQQPLDENGVKLDTAIYQSSRYDPDSRRRQQQRVILETSSRHGLPTPADENVILALLYVAKHAHDFSDPVVRFSPRQLFHIMGWAPNSRSYDRLRDVLRRLKSLVIRYENSWWDIAGRGYEAEVATGIISEYELGRQVAGRKKGAKAPSCWVSWTPHFQKSLSNGNLKKLDLDRLFSLRLPTSQRMYRFLDKRFYPPQAPPPVEMDLQDFACGHIGLAPVANVAELKRRLAPAIAELENIGFIAKTHPEERYQKVRPGVWRIRFTAGPQFLPPTLPDPLRERQRVALPPPEKTSPVRPVVVPAETALVKDFYTRWDPQQTGHIGENDLLQAREILGKYGASTAHALLPYLVALVKKRWPECKTFSGAAGKYLGEAVRAYEQRQRRAEQKETAKNREQQERQEASRQLEERRQREQRWQALSEEERQEIERDVLQKHPALKEHPAILRSLCLRELG
jgi:hypothetical protein